MSHSVRTAGMTFGAIKMDGHKIRHAFQIYSDRDVFINADGILGTDSLRAYNATINFGEMYLQCIYTMARDL